MTIRAAVREVVLIVAIAVALLTIYMGVLLIIVALTERG